MRAHPDVTLLNDLRSFIGACSTESIHGPSAIKQQQIQDAAEPVLFDLFDDDSTSIGGDFEQEETHRGVDVAAGGDGMVLGTITVVAGGDEAVEAASSVAEHVTADKNHKQKLEHADDDKLDSTTAVDVSVGGRLQCVGSAEADEETLAAPAKTKRSKTAKRNERRVREAADEQVLKAALERAQLERNLQQRIVGKVGEKLDCNDVHLAEGIAGANGARFGEVKLVKAEEYAESDEEPVVIQLRQAIESMRRSPKYQDTGLEEALQGAWGWLGRKHTLYKLE